MEILDLLRVMANNDKKLMGKNEELFKMTFMNKLLTMMISIK